MSLFGETEDPNNERDEKLDKKLDPIRSRFGSSIVRRGTENQRQLCSGVELTFLDRADGVARHAHNFCQSTA